MYSRLEYTFPLLFCVVGMAPWLLKLCTLYLVRGVLVHCEISENLLSLVCYWHEVWESFALSIHFVIAFRFINFVIIMISNPVSLITNRGKWKKCNVSSKQNLCKGTDFRQLFRRIQYPTSQIESCTNCWFILTSFLLLKEMKLVCKQI
jgi:hypothetical protein